MAKNKNLSDEELFFYESVVGDETYIDYEKLVDRYYTGLLLFCSDEEEYKSFYMNLIFLSCVVKGFSYYHDKIYSEELIESLDDNDLVIYILEKYFTLQENSDKDNSNISLSDKIYMTTCCIYKKMEEINIEEADVNTTLTMLYNTLAIEKSLNECKSVEKGKIYGMENRKYPN